QAVALSIPRVTPELNELYESFLEDSSYITIENALYKLWVSFPEDRIRYLEQTKGRIGLPNKSLRMTWLLLAMLTPNFGDPAAKAAFEKELMGYTSVAHGQDIRKNAFLLIREVLDPTDQYLLDLSQACVHHSWQFRSFARNLMGELLEEESLRERVKGMLNRLEPEERAYLKNVLEL
ncbi:MAG: M1 family peptidase, partial [Eudoraea sp.]|nr:M1 family peptidase [Eudoraea sp.]